MVRFSIKQPAPVKSTAKNKKRFKLQKISKPLVMLMVVILSALAYGAYRFTDKPDSLVQEPTPSVQQNQDIDFSPATEEDKSDVDELKANLGNDNSSSNDTGVGERKVVTPIIVGSTSSSPVTVRSYISGIIESGGICTLTLTNGSTSLSAEGSASAGAQTTDCPELTVELPSSGTWQAEISYLSSSSQGRSSQDWEIKIQ